MRRRDYGILDIYAVLRSVDSGCYDWLRRSLEEETAEGD